MTTTTIDLDRQRAEFEREALRLDILDDEGLERNDAGDYIDEPAQAAWKAWRAATQQAARAQQEPVAWIEAAVQACYAERVNYEETRAPEDAAYNQAIENCIDAIRKFAAPVAQQSEAGDARVRGTEYSVTVDIPTEPGHYEIKSSNGITTITPTEAGAPTAAAEPIYQIATKHGFAWTDVTPEVYEQYGGAAFRQRIVYLAPASGRESAAPAAPVREGDREQDAKPGMQPELMRQAVASVVSRAGNEFRVGWLRPERVEVGTLLYCAVDQKGAQHG